MKDDIKEHFSWEDDPEDNSEEEIGVEEPEKPEEIEEVAGGKGAKEKGKKESKESKEGKKTNKRQKKGNKKKSSFMKIAIWSAALLIIAVSLFVVYKDSIFPKKGVAVETVAIVNGEAISSGLLEASYKLLVPRQIQGIISKEFFLEDSLVTSVLLAQEAVKEGITVSDYEVDIYFEEFIKRIGMTKDEFMLEIKDEGIDFEDVREAQRMRMIVASILDKKISSQIKITDQEIIDYYENNKEEFSAKEGQIKASHILVGTKEEAEGILSELENGAEFSLLAFEKSIDPSAKVNRGNLGLFSKGQMVPEFEEAAFSLDMGEMSDPVKTQFGYHIIKRESDVSSFDETKDNVRMSLFMAKQESVLKTYISQLKNKAEIVLYPENAFSDEGLAEAETTFIMTDDDVCKENEKPIIRLFSAGIDPHSRWISDAFNTVVHEFSGEISAYNWEIDTGDNLLTEKIEDKVPIAEFEVYKEYSGGAVPMFIFGCKYVRIGNGYENEGDLEKEKAEFRMVIGKLV